MTRIIVENGEKLAYIGGAMELTRQEITIQTPYGDCNISTWRSGNGPALLFLHGWGQDHKALAPLASLLRDAGEIIMIDLPGFGESPPPPAAWSSKEYSELTAEIIRKLELKDITIISHSFGGRIAIRLAANHLDAVKKIVIIAGSGLRRIRPLTWHAKALFIRYALKAARRISGRDGEMTKMLIEKYGSRDYRSAGPMRPTFVKIVNEDLSPFLEPIRIPVLLIWGQDDEEVPPEIGERMEHGIVGAELHLLAGFDHYSILGSGKHLLEGLIKRFMKDQRL